MYPFDLPLNPGADEARDWLVQELSKSEYQVSRNLLEEFIRWILEQLFGKNAPDTGTGKIVIVGLVLLVLTGVAWYIARLRRSKISKLATGPVQPLLEEGVSSAEYLTRAIAASQRRDFDETIISAYRSIVSGLDDRGVLGDMPGRTAQEVAEQIGIAFPDWKEQIESAAVWFDQAAYGMGPSPRCSAAQAEQLIRLAQSMAKLKTGKPE